MNSKPPELTSQIVELFQQEDTYSPAASQVETIETHISYVFLTDHEAYKLRKGVKFEFVDFSTAELRKQDCEDEVRLNRRLAPDLYLGVLPITRDTDGNLALDGAGEPVDWVVKMHRLDLASTLEERIRTDALSAAEIDQVSQFLAGAYADVKELSLAGKLTGSQYREHVEQHVRANLADLLEYDSFAPSEPCLIRRVHAAQLLLLAALPDWFERRVSEHYVIEGHGDLRPEHICLKPRPLAFDCVEFNAEFRQIDVLDELGFLAMECDMLQRADVGQAVLDAYLAESRDPADPRLLLFYKAYRACVRGKVAALRSTQLADDARDKAMSDAHRYMQAAGEYTAQMLRPVLLVMRGVSGSGKSTLARELADQFAVQRISSDEVRQMVQEKNDSEPGLDEERYAPAARDAVYQALLGEAEKTLRGHAPVILDASFLEARWLDWASELATKTGATLLVVETDCPAEVAQDRIAERRTAGSDASEARPELVPHQLETREAVPRGIPLVQVDATRTLAAQQADVMSRLGELWSV